jgi:integrase
MERFVGKAYTAEQANMLLGVIDNEPMKPAIILALFYGLRRSEVLGLRWKDVDFTANTITIRNAVVKVKTLIEHEKTKSRASNRTLLIIPETRDYFLDLRCRQNENRLLLGNAYNDNGHVCVWDDGRMFSTEYVSRHFALILKKNDLPHIRFHELRHTAGSLLLNKGLSAKQIQEYLGHERVSTALDFYGHLNAEGKKEAAYTIGSLLKIKIN